MNDEKPKSEMAQFLEAPGPTIYQSLAELEAEQAALARTVPVLVRLFLSASGRGSGAQPMSQDPLP